MNLEDAIKNIQNEFRTLFPELSDYELEIVAKSMRMPFQKVYTSVISMTEYIQETTAVLSGIRYLKTKFISVRYRKNLEVRNKYEKLYTVLTRSGRPSRQAIDSEIYYGNPELSQIRDFIEGVDNLIDFLDGQSAILEITIRNYENQKFHSN